MLYQPIPHLKIKNKDSKYSWRYKIKKGAKGPFHINYISIMRGSLNYGSTGAVPKFVASHENGAALTSALLSEKVLTTELSVTSLTL